MCRDYSLYQLKLCLIKKKFTYRHFICHLTNNRGQEMITPTSLVLISIEIINRILKPA